MNYFTRILSLLALVFLTACGGGGGNSGTAVLGGGETSGRLNDLVVVLGGTTLANTGSATMTVTATALDANRNALANVPVTLSVDNGAVLNTAQTVTGTDGTIVGTVSIGADRSNRTITVTARSGSIERKASFAVVESAGTAIASEMVLVLSAASIANNGTQTVTATATALDAKRNTLPGVPIALTVNSNAVISPNATTTDATGTVRGAVSIGSDRTNRIITVTATSGALVRTATLQVSDATGGTPVAADLSLVLSAPSLNNAGSTTLTATATAVDANRNVISGIPVTIKVDNNAVLAVSGSTTNASGVVTAQVGIGADRSNRLVTVTAASGSLTRSATFRVTGAALSASNTPVILASSQNNKIEFKLVDTNAAGMVGQAYSVSAPGLPTQTGVTDFAGKFVYTFNAPTQAGSVQLTATSAGDSITLTIPVEQGGSPPDAVGAIRSASVAPTPSVISVNSRDSSANQSELRVLFIGDNNAPIKNVRVRFDLDGNTSTTDGRIVPETGSYAYSDELGVARGVFIPGLRSSPTDGVTIRACYSATDFPAGSCPNFTRAKLTVANEALSVSIGTDNTIKSGRLTYIKEYVVMVVDAAGNPKSDITITPQVDLTAYRKGFYVLTLDNVWVKAVRTFAPETWTWDAAGRAWSFTSGAPADLTDQICPNEDVNRNAVREAAEFTGNPLLAARGEDYNWTGALEPRKADVAIKVVGSPRTDINGLAVVQLEYPESHGTWIDFVITVTASGISGTEVKAKWSDTLPAAADDFKGPASPAFVTSPYGRATTCVDPK